MADFTDARGISIRHFKEHPVRIVSVVPSQTELLYHLGLNDEVVGITKFCIHPEHWFRNKTRVGGTKNLNVEQVKRLKPDLILANKEENTKEQVEALANDFPVWVTDVNSLDNALEMIEAAGVLTGRLAAATFLKAYIDNAFTQLNEIKKTMRFRVCYLIWNDPYLAVGGDTFIHAMLQQAGFENVFASETRYPEITMERLQNLNCDVLLLSSEPYPFSEKHVNHFQTHLPHTKILLVDGEPFSWYGSRLQWAPDYFKKLHAQLREA